MYVLYRTVRGSKIAEAIVEPFLFLRATCMHKYCFEHVKTLVPLAL